MPKIISLSKNHGYVLSISVGLLMAIWPLPATMALRNILLLIGATYGVVIVYKFWPMIVRQQIWPIYLPMAFFAWLIVQFFLFTNQSGEHLAEISGVWLRTFAAALTGFALGVVVNESRSNPWKLVEVLFLTGICATSLIYVITYLVFSAQSGVWLAPPFFQENYAGKPPIVFFGSLTLVVCYIKLHEAMRNGSWINIGFCCALIFVCLFNFVFADTKNGILMFVLISLVFLLFLFRSFISELKKYLNKLILVAAIVMFAIPAINYHIERNHFWKNVLPNISVAWDIDTHQQWKRKEGEVPLPTNENGETVNGSAYARIAWAHAGLILIGENPLGYGLLNQSFGALAIKKWIDFKKPDGTTRGATHSAWIDITLGVGVPGLLLVISCMLIIFHSLRKDFSTFGKFGKCTLPVIFILFLVTEIASDVYIEFLFFYILFFMSRSFDNQK